MTAFSTAASFEVAIAGRIHAVERDRAGRVLSGGRVLGRVERVEGGRGPRRFRALDAGGRPVVGGYTAAQAAVALAYRALRADAIG